MTGGTTSGTNTKPSRDMEPTEFTADNLNKHNKAPIINSLIKTKAKEAALTDKQTEVQRIISAVIESMKNVTDKTDYKSLVELSSKNLEKISWKIKINEPEKLLSTEDNSKIEADEEASNNIIAHTHHYGTNTSSKITKLDSNTPTYSNKPGERLDEWLFVLNQAFTVLDIRDGKQKLGLASTNVRGPVLQALIRYTKDDIHANWDGFTKIL